MNIESGFSQVAQSLLWPVLVLVGLAFVYALWSGGATLMEAWQRWRGCGTTWIRNRGAMLSKGSGAAAKRGLLHDRFIGTTAGQRYGTIAHGSRIKDGSRDTGGYMSDSAAMLPSADGIHNMAANVQLCSTSSAPEDLVTKTCLPDWEPV